MPIYSLEGTPGSGKTLYCVQKLIPDFLKIRDSSGNLIPRHIYTNIEGFRPELLCAYAGIPYEAIADYIHILGQRTDENGHVFEDKDYVRYWYYEPQSIEWVEEQNGNRQIEKHPDWEKAKQIPNGSLVIIDELQNYYSNRDFATIYSKKCIEFITKNRHYGWTLFYMTQSVESIDVTFRRNTQYVYFLERREIFGSSDTSSVKMYEGWLAGDKVNTPPFAKQKFTFDKRYYNAYKSYVQGVTGEKRYKVNIFLQHKGLMAMAIIALIALVYVVLSDPLATISGKKSLKQQQPPSPTPPTHQSFSGAVGAVGQFATVADTLKKELCYTNFYKSFGEYYVILNNGKTKRVNVGEHYEECK